jgi:hypothetical protein
MCAEQQVEQTPRLADKGLAACIFLGAGAFADQHQRGLQGTPVDDCLGPG